RLRYWSTRDWRVSCLVEARDAGLEGRRDLQFMGSLDADIRAEHHHSDDCQRPYPGATSGTRLSTAAAMAGPVRTIPRARNTAMNRSIAATPTVVPISTNECPESKPGRADPSAPACSSVQ